MMVYPIGLAYIHSATHVNSSFLFRTHLWTLNIV